MDKFGWKIIDENGAKKLGIEALKLDAGNYIMMDLSCIPKGLSIQELLELAQENKIIFKYGHT